MSVGAEPARASSGGARLRLRNAFVESFDGKHRDEGPNLHRFRSIRHAREEILGWRHHDNTERPHSSLGYLTPAAFATTLRTQRASTLRHTKSLAQMPVALGEGARDSQSTIPVVAR